MENSKKKSEKTTVARQTHMGFGPENEDLSHHPEQLLCIRIGTGQPPCPADTHSKGFILQKNSFPFCFAHTKFECNIVLRRLTADGYGTIFKQALEAAVKQILYIISLFHCYR